MTNSGMIRGVIGAVMLFCAPSLALAAPKAAGGTGGAAGTTTIPAGGTAGTAPSAAPTEPAAPAPAAPAPADATVPAAPAPTDVAPPAPTEPSVAPPADEEQAPARKKKKKKKRRHVDEDMDDAADSDNRWTTPSEDEAEGESSEVGGWRASHTSFILSAERLTSITAWSNTQNVEVSTGGFGGTSTSTEEIESSGTDVAFLGNLPLRNAYSLPRLAFDGRFSNGFTIGGSIAYIAMSGKHDDLTVNGSRVEKTSRDDADVAFFVFAPRIGVFFEASPSVSVWLRGGLTRISASSERAAVNDGGVTIPASTSTATVLAVTLDPQLVFTPIPHVGITLGGALDIGASGSVETESDGESKSQDNKASSYGVTGGLALLF